MSMRYLCYLSKERVDTLFESAFDGIVDATTDTRGVENEFKSEVGLSGMLAWIKAGLSLGRKESKASQSSKRKTAVSRLEKVVEYINRSTKVGDLSQIINEKGMLDCDWYTVSGAFSVSNWERISGSTELVGQIADYQLKLSCATASFSGVYKEGDKYIPTSTNRYLFEGAVSLPMSGLVKVSFGDVENRTLLATPLYLVLNPLNQDLGDYNDVEI